MITADEVLDRIAYLYTNPERDGVVDSVNNYPGVSSWKRYRGKLFTITAKKIPRACIPKLENPEKITRYERLEICELFSSLIGDPLTIELKPYDCLRCFESLEEYSDQELDEMILGRIETYRISITPKKTAFRDKKASKVMKIDLDYEPKKFGKKTVVLSSCSKLRGKFIEWFKSIRDEARRVYEEWKKFNFEEPWPLYLYPPPKPRNISPAEFFS